MNETLAQGIYNRMSRTVHDRLLQNLEAVKRMPAGRQRRSPWYRNRLTELRLIYKDLLLFETESGQKKNRVRRLYVLEVGDHQRPQLGCIEVHARDFDIKYNPLSIYINRHAVARIIQACKGSNIDDITPFISSAVYVALNIISNTNVIQAGHALRIATEDGLWIWDVEQQDCNADHGIIMKTFICADVLDGSNAILYADLMERDEPQRFRITRKRVLNA